MKGELLKQLLIQECKILLVRLWTYLRFIIF